MASELGHLPLVLDQAAAVIAGQHLSYAAYLANLRALSAEDYPFRWEDDEQPSSPGVAEAVMLSLDAASAADPLSVCTGVMELMAMLSPARSAATPARAPPPRPPSPDVAKRMGVLTGPAPPAPAPPPLFPWFRFLSMSFLYLSFPRSLSGVAQFRCDPGWPTYEPSSS